MEKQKDHKNGTKGKTKKIALALAVALLPSLSQADHIYINNGTGSITKCSLYSNGTINYGDCSNFPTYDPIYSQSAIKVDDAQGLLYYDSSDYQTNACPLDKSTACYPLAFNLNMTFPNTFALQGWYLYDSNSKPSDGLGNKGSALIDTTEPYQYAQYPSSIAPYSAIGASKYAYSYVFGAKGNTSDYPLLSMPFTGSGGFITSGAVASKYGLSEEDVPRYVVQDSDSAYFYLMLAPVTLTNPPNTETLVVFPFANNGTGVISSFTSYTLPAQNVFSLKVHGNHLYYSSNLYSSDYIYACPLNAGVVNTTSCTVAYTKKILQYSGFDFSSS